MLERDSLKKRAHRASNARDWRCYRALRRDVKLKIKLSEIELVKNEIIDNKRNKTSIWKMVRHCLNPCGSSVLAYSRDCTEIANEFNNYFISVGKNAAHQAQQLASDHHLQSLLTLLFRNTWVVTHGFRLIALHRNKYKRSS